MEKSYVLENLIHHNGLSMETSRIGSNPINMQQGELDETKHYRCRLYRPGQQVDMYLSVEKDDETPALPDVLLMLAMDASGCKMLEGFEECRDEWPAIFGGSDGNLKEIESFWQEYQCRCKQTEQFKEFLGQPVYEELLRYFDGGNPLRDYASALSEDFM